LPNAPEISSGTFTTSADANLESQVQISVFFHSGYDGPADLSKIGQEWRERVNAELSPFEEEEINGLTMLTASGTIYDAYDLYQGQETQLIVSIIGDQELGQTPDSRAWILACFGQSIDHEDMRNLYDDIRQTFKVLGVGPE